MRQSRIRAAQPRGYGTQGHGVCAPGPSSLDFLLAPVLDKFVYLKVGLSFLLIFVGGKTLLLDIGKVPIGASRGIIAAIVGLSIVASLLRPAPQGGDAPVTKLA